MRTTALCTAAFILIISLAPRATTAAEEEFRPGPVLVLRDNGITEQSFVPPRRAAEPAPKVVTAQFVVDYNGFTPQAEAAFQAAVDVASELFVSPVTIRVEANWESLDEDVLGNARSEFIWRNFPNAPLNGVFYVDALADVLAGSDRNPGGYDIVATFNSDFDYWYFGTDGNTPSGQSDFMSVVLHELCHGLGFTGSATVENGIGSWGVLSQGSIYPVIYDLFVVNAGGTPVTDESSYPNPSTILANVLQGNALYWDGPMAVAANNGSRPRLYAPSSWEEGSSFSHLNEFTYPAGNPNSLMTPGISRGEAIHDPGPITLCIFEDTGWETAESCGAAETSSYWVAAAARASGAGGSQWRTTLGLFNSSASDATVDISYHRNGGSTATTSLSLPAGGHTMIDDVVGFLGSGGTGPIEVEANLPIAVGSRTFNQSANGTFGQFLDGIPPSDHASNGDVVWLTMLRENADFRSNIGFTNSGSSTAVVNVILYDGTGAQVTAFSVTVPARSNVQENRPFSDRGGRTDINSGTAKVTVNAGSGVLIYGSVIDNLTGDPTTIPPK